MIGKMLDQGQVWFAPMRDIAAHVRGCSENGTWTPRTEQPLTLPRADGGAEAAAAAPPLKETGR
jgi:hypothetical protein